MENPVTTIPSTSGSLTNPNFPLLPGGATMHLGVNAGDVANRILSVGDHGRALRISNMLDDPEKTKKVGSDRGFITYTGTYKGIPVSIIATGMGIAMIDFVVRESTLYISSTTAIIRLGTTGLLRNDLPVGSVAVARSARIVQQNHDYNPDSPSKEAYFISQPVDSDVELKQILMRNLSKTENIAEGVNITCDTFYSAQGRIDGRFEDYNQDLIDHIKTTEPDATNLEMESFKLLHLASKSKGKIKAGSCAIGLVNRYTSDVLSFEDLRAKELTCGQAILDTLVEYDIN